MPFDDSKMAQMVDFGANTYPCLSIPSPDGSRYFVSLWGAAAVAVVNAQALSIEARWPTPPHTKKMVFPPDGGRLFVSCANSNEAVSIDPVTGNVLEVISSAIFPGAEAGSTPTSLAISDDGALLAIANACNNNLAIVNIEQPGKAKPLGFGTTGWYPTSVRFGPGGELYVANGKGLSPKANRHGPNPERPVPRTLQEYIASIFTGSLSVIKPIQPETLATMTAGAFRCIPLLAQSGVRNAGREPVSPIPAAVGEPSPIKYCVYIIKENRTYDQIFGDMPQGNGAR